MPEYQKRQDMTDDEIRDVFLTLRLPLDASAALSPQRPGPPIFFRTTGYSPPLGAPNGLGITQPSAELERTSQ
jgi:hypothetical protein